ncbi:MAG: putative DNA binding domain-containing protein [Proteobacteria bacterium]|nr:putative DNA binding domain-containing protein [Pseudomonadota bacterium]MBU4469478.1 putative DNA binding domain-containing protein [Pseudomonadota bacterium]
MRYDDQALEQLLYDTESDMAERKEAWAGDAPEKGRQAVCAFANDLPDHRKSGVLFVGVKDDGTPVELDVSDRLLQTLSDIKTDGNILPPPTITVSKRKLKGVDVAVVTVQPADAPPVRYKGRIWIRIGPRRGVATAQDERILNEKRRYRDLPFDVVPLPSSSITALDRVMFEQEYLPQAFARDILEANERSFEQKLAACKMISSIDNPIPTVLGLLVLGKSVLDWIPGSYVQFLRIDGMNLSDNIIDELKIDGPLNQIIRRLDEKLQAHNLVSVDAASEHRETRRYAYPVSALQQLTRNAIMHRTYEGTNSPSRVYWFNDRIEIYSPGGAFGIVNSANFGRPGITDYRNPNLAAAMRVLGFVQRFGVGISMANNALRENGNPPAEFQVNPESVLATLRRIA